MRRVLRGLVFGLALGVAWVPAAGPAQAVETADLSITVSWAGGGPAKASVGQTVTYAVSVTNLGPSAASGVTVFATTPDQFNPVSIMCSDASFCSAPGGTLPAGSTITATVIDVVCCFPKGDSRTTSAGAVVVTATTDPNLNNNSARVSTRIVGPHGFSSG